MLLLFTNYATLNVVLIYKTENWMLEMASTTKVMQYPSIGTK